MVHMALLQRCIALLQPRMWCMRCSCKAAWHCCNPCTVHVLLLQRCMVLVQPMLGAHSVLAKVHGIAATHARCTCCPCKSAWHWCNPDVVHEVPLQRWIALLQPMLGARSVLAKVHGIAASHAQCTWCSCKGALRWCNPDVVHEVLLQSCMALVQPMLGAHSVLAKVHSIAATPMWCMRCSCKAV